MIFRRLYTGFLKSRVIPLSYHVDRVCASLVNNHLENPYHSFQFDNPEKYYELRFYGYLSKYYFPDFDLMTDFEQDKYKEALNKLEQFN